MAVQTVRARQKEVERERTAIELQQDSIHFDRCLYWIVFWYSFGLQRLLVIKYNYLCVSLFLPISIVPFLLVSSLYITGASTATTRTTTTEKRIMFLSFNSFLPFVSTMCGVYESELLCTCMSDACKHVCIQSAFKIRFGVSFDHFSLLDCSLVSHFVMLPISFVHFSFTFFSLSFNARTQH